MPVDQTIQELEDQILEQEKFQDPDTINAVENQYNKELEQGDAPSVNTTFSFGIMLCSSPEATEKARGLAILRGLIERTLGSPENRDVAIDSLYYMAMANMRLGRLEQSRAVCERVLRINPDNSKARVLHRLVSHKQSLIEQRSSERTIAATAVGLGVGLLAFALARRT
jgi:hypothetical protein